ncbi:phenylalanine--tRNA ligase subunit alpha [Candidatus Roizmanbacteria bacterium CG10_big_fil_rev_8_21_14_0_10_39_6]|uniref:Phenylalanine--tRNA ligase alpha subunit n=1 Tax=Candidatus Roizmanbacteria bacterium CG10_big_fil_rev_8_21_14_0_10_39_6 TaxID=1974853 RepID=A0A2M8KTJ2_9BACT|nr:MAG: phenylalanine--tRNA ligase subunit alpha [Candidatus Roizmanbacteria bacterium CG10_big_fil_rev_8_21_14_0_10_39_6]
MDSNVQSRLTLYVRSFENAPSLDDLLKIYTEVLGKKGYLARLFQTLAQEDDIEKKKTIGAFLNREKQKLERAFSKKQDEFLQTKTAIVGDITVPSIGPKLGNMHIITSAIEEIRRIYSRIGFYQYSYPEVEWEYFSFEALNMPSDHPARDDFETFFVDGPVSKKYGRMVLTPHTSNGQVREMSRVGKPPIRMINIARCYRPNWDITHVPMMHQFEGLCVDKGISIQHLKGTMSYFAREFFGYDVKTRLRPHNFEFTEPSFEVDIRCIHCKGTGMTKEGKCRICKSGWLELGGSGLVHPNVLKAGGIDSSLYSGWAFGFGIERVAMIKYQIDDIRKLYSGELRYVLES